MGTKARVRPDAKRDSIAKIPLGAKLAAGILLIVIAFAVAQPMLWRVFFKEDPPDSTQDTATNAEIAVTIVSIGLGVFGIILYQLAEKSIQARVEEARVELKKKVDEESQALDEKIEEFNSKRESNFEELATAEARLLIRLSTLAWLAYEEPWRAEGYRNEESIPGFRKLVRTALRSAKAAGHIVEKFPAEEFTDARMASENNVAYHLGTLRDPLDKKEAFRLAGSLARLPEASQPVYAETLAWVYLRFSKPGSDDWEVGLTWLRMFAHGDPPVDQETRSEVLTKYKALFGLDLGVVASPGRAAPGGDPPREHTE